LAGVSSAYNVRSNNVSPVDLFDVAMVWHLRPMLFQYATGVQVNFGLPDYVHAGAL